MVIFFIRFYEEEWEDCLICENLGLNKFSMEDGVWLIRVIEEDEIKKVVWSCEGVKVFGFDGFNLNFIKEVWEVIKSDIVNAINIFL